MKNVNNAAEQTFPRAGSKTESSTERLLRRYIGSVTSAMHTTAPWEVGEGVGVKTVHIGNNSGAIQPVQHQHTHHLNHGCTNHDTEGKHFKSTIHCCDITKPPYLFSGELCTSPLHCKLLFVTPCAVCAPGSASLCSEHINQTSY